MYSPKRKKLEVGTRTFFQASSIFGWNIHPISPSMCPARPSESFDRADPQCDTTWGPKSFAAQKTMFGRRQFGIGYSARNLMKRYQKILLSLEHVSPASKMESFWVSLSNFRGAPGIPHLGGSKDVNLITGCFWLTRMHPGPYVWTLIPWESSHHMHQVSIGVELSWTRL